MACGRPHAIFEDGVCGRVRVRSHTIPGQAWEFTQGLSLAVLDLGLRIRPVSLLVIVVGFEVFTKALSLAVVYTGLRIRPVSVISIYLWVWGFTLGLSIISGCLVIWGFAQALPFYNINSGFQDWPRGCHLSLIYYVDLGFRIGPQSVLSPGFQDWPRVLLISCNGFVTYILRRLGFQDWPTVGHLAWGFRIGPRLLLILYYCDIRLGFQDWPTVCHLAWGFRIGPGFYLYYVYGTGACCLCRNVPNKLPYVPHIAKNIYFVFIPLAPSITKCKFCIASS